MSRVQHTSNQSEFHPSFPVFQVFGILFILLQHCRIMPRNTSVAWTLPCLKASNSITCLPAFQNWRRVTCKLIFYALYLLYLCYTPGWAWPLDKWASDTCGGKVSTVSTKLKPVTFFLLFFVPPRHEPLVWISLPHPHQYDDLPKAYTLPEMFEDTVPSKSLQNSH